MHGKKESSNLEKTLMKKERAAANGPSLKGKLDSWFGFVS